MEIIIAAALTVASRSFARKESGAASLLQAGHTYTQSPVTGGLCPVCREADEDLDTTEEGPDGCTCERDWLTGARGFTCGGERDGEMLATMLTGVRRSNDATEVALAKAIGLESRAEREREMAATERDVFGPEGWDMGDEHEANAESLESEADELLATIPQATRWGSTAEGLIDTATEFADDGGRWAHELDAYMAGQAERESSESRTRADWTPVTYEHTVMLGRVAASKRAAAAAAERNARFHRLAQEIRRARSNERRAVARFDWQTAKRWRERSFAIMRGVMERYHAMLGCGADWHPPMAPRFEVLAHGAGDSMSCLYLTREQLTRLWALNERRK